MKVTVKDVSFKERISKKTNKPYKLYTFTDSTNRHFVDLYLGISSLTDGQEIDIQKTDTGWELIKELYKPSEKQFKADPASRDSIEKQKALAEAVNFMQLRPVDRSYSEIMSETLMVAKEFLAFVRDPESVDVLADLPDDTTLDDLPPVENYR